MAKLLISHTHEGAAWAARVHARLAAQHGDQHVYFDVADIPAGAGGPGTAGRVAEVAAVVAVIDPGWLGPDGPDPGVAAELEAAMRRGIPVVPVLVDGAYMPRDEDLPPAIRNLVARPAVALGGATFDDDAERLDAELARLGLQELSPAALPGAVRQRRLALVIAVSLLILGIVVFVAIGGETNSWAPPGL